MGFFKNRYFVVILSLTVSFVLAFILIPAVAGYSRGTVDVVRVSKVIPPGCRIDKSMLRIGKAGRADLPETVIRNPDDIIGKYSKVELLPEDNLVMSKFSGSEELEDGFLYKIAGDNLVALSISVKNPAAGLSGKLKPGDVISLITFKRDESGGASVCVLRPELQFIEVASVSMGKNNGDNSGSITLKVTREQAGLIVEAENTGNIHVVCNGRGEESRKLLNERG